MVPAQDSGVHAGRARPRPSAGRPAHSTEQAAGSAAAARCPALPCPPPLDACRPGSQRDVRLDAGGLQAVNQPVIEGDALLQGCRPGQAAARVELSPKPPWGAGGGGRRARGSRCLEWDQCKCRVAAGPAAVHTWLTAPVPFGKSRVQERLKRKLRSPRVRMSATSSLYLQAGREAGGGAQQWRQGLGPRRGHSHGGMTQHAAARPAAWRTRMSLPWRQSISADAIAPGSDAPCSLTAGKSPPPCRRSVPQTFCPACARTRPK